MPKLFSDPIVGNRLAYYPPETTDPKRYQAATVASVRYEGEGDAEQVILNVAVLGYNGEWSAKRDVQYARNGAAAQSLAASGDAFCTEMPVQFFAPQLAQDTALSPAPQSGAIDPPSALDYEGTLLQRGDPVICVNADGNDGLRVGEKYEVVEIVSMNVISIGAMTAGSNRF